MYPATKTPLSFTLLKGTEVKKDNETDLGCLNECHRLRQWNRKSWKDIHETSVSLLLWNSCRHCREIIELPCTIEFSPQTSSVKGNRKISFCILIPSLLLHMISGKLANPTSFHKAYRLFLLSPSPSIVNCFQTQMALLKHLMLSSWILSLDC